MSDNPMLAFAIGSLAASRGASERARLAADIMTPRPPQTTRINAETAALIQALQEREQHIHDQDKLIEELQRKIDEWKAYAAEIEARRARQEEYAIWAEAELKKHTGQK